MRRLPPFSPCGRRCPEGGMRGAGRNELFPKQAPISTPPPPARSVQHSSSDPAFRGAIFSHKGRRSGASLAAAPLTRLRGADETPRRLDPCKTPGSIVQCVLVSKMQFPEVCIKVVETPIAHAVLEVAIVDGGNPRRDELGELGLRDPDPAGVIRSRVFNDFLSRKQRFEMGAVSCPHPEQVWIIFVLNGRDESVVETDPHILSIQIQQPHLPLASQKRVDTE
jgi:hypothetical protein